jgi:TonB family protein
MAADPPKPGEGPRPAPAPAIDRAPTPKPVQKEIVGHRATVSDTESVPFAKADSVTFVAGKLEGRQGVRVRTTQPRYGDASIHDSEIIGDQPTVFGTTVDRDGNVIDVQILQSSGSTNIDQDRKNAVWNWILEPKRDTNGHLICTWVINFG